MCTESQLQAIRLRFIHFYTQKNFYTKLQPEEEVSIEAAAGGGRGSEEVSESLA